MSDQSKLGIGQIITSEQFKDAIHVAVAPVKAAHRLMPGDHVGLDGDGEATDKEKWIGIVDPFLTTWIGAGETFWLFLYPGSITSLRHDWSHPAFLDPTVPIVAPQTPKEKSKAFLEKVASACGVDFEDMISAIENDDYIHMGENERYKDVLRGPMYDEFVAHCRLYLDKPTIEPYPFSCSC